MHSGGLASSLSRFSGFSLDLPQFSLIHSPRRLGVDLMQYYARVECIVDTAKIIQHLARWLAMTAAAQSSLAFTERNSHPGRSD